MLASAVLLRVAVPIVAVYALLGAAVGAWAETIEVSGKARTFSLIAGAKRPAPLVIVLHGATQSGEDMLKRTSWPELARREGFALLAPQGLNRSWADHRGPNERIAKGPPPGTDDVAFLTALIDHEIAAGVADPRRISVTGVSNGGAMTLTMVCERADRIAAAASVIMNMTDGLAASCQPIHRVPVMLMNGTADPLIPYNGGKGTNWFATSGFWSTQRTLEFWRLRNGCKSDDVGRTRLANIDPRDDSTVTRIDSNCPEGHDVVLYRVDGGGHRMPSRNTPDSRMPRLVGVVLGPQNRDIDGPEVIWAFFKRFAS